MPAQSQGDKRPGWMQEEHIKSHRYLRMTGIEYQWLLAEGSDFFRYTALERLFMIQWIALHTCEYRQYWMISGCSKYEYMVLGGKGGTGRLGRNW